MVDEVLTGLVICKKTAVTCRFLLAFNEHKLYRTVVRRRICVRQIYLLFSKSTQRVDFIDTLTSKTHSFRRFYNLIKFIRHISHT